MPTKPAKPAKRVTFGTTMRGLIITLCGLYTFGLIALAWLWVQMPDRWWWVAGTKAVAPHFFWPVGLMLIIGLLIGSRRVFGFTLILGLIFGGLFGLRFIPREPPYDYGQPELRVISFNTWRENPGAEELASLLVQQEADVLMLQELSEENHELLAERLNAAYPYQQYDYEGLALFSRYPFNGSGELQNVRGLWAMITVEDQELMVVNVHIHRRTMDTRRLPGLPWLPIPRDYDTSPQQNQIQQLVGELTAAQMPVVVAGDFNTVDSDPAYDLLASQFTDSYRTISTGFGFTYPNKRRFGPLETPFPLIRLDYVWSTPGIAPKQALVNCSGGSDHCMLVTDLLIEPGGF